jgi:hypothetical protein
VVMLCKLYAAQNGLNLAHAAIANGRHRAPRIQRLLSGKELGGFSFGTSASKSSQMPV